MSVCSQGHSSASEDYCDVCGSPMAAAGSAPAEAAPAQSGSAPAPALVGGAASGGVSGSGTAPAGDGSGTGPDQTCPVCAATSGAQALFCEACGADFVTGSVPPESTWVVEIWVDPQWGATQDLAEPPPSPGPPRIVHLPGTTALVGRPSTSRNITPDVDCGADTGVSRRQCQLTFDGVRWMVEDLGSANGTYLGAVDQPLPTEPIATGKPMELSVASRIYVGAWTRLAVRAAASGE